MFTYTAFEQLKILTSGPLEKVALDIKKRLKQKPGSNILIFSDLSGKQIDIDLSGTDSEVINRLKIYNETTTTPTTGPGRPKLGVIAREVSLLPRHWEWLSVQDGGASATIRKLIEEKMNTQPLAKNLIKESQESTYKFLSAIGGDLPNFEEAIRYLYRKDKKKFVSLMKDWPKDIVAYTLELSAKTFGDN